MGKRWLHVACNWAWAASLGVPSEPMQPPDINYNTDMTIYTRQPLSNLHPLHFVLLTCEFSQLIPTQHVYSRVQLNMSKSLCASLRHTGHTLLRPELGPRKSRNIKPGKVETVFHGTSKEAAKAILKEGFNPSKDGLLGKGVYVTTDPSIWAYLGVAAILSPKQDTATGGSLLGIILTSFSQWYCPWVSRFSG